MSLPARIAACEAIRGEVVAALAMVGLGGIEVAAHPAVCRPPSAAGGKLPIPPEDGAIPRVACACAGRPTPTPHRGEGDDLILPSCAHLVCPATLAEALVRDGAYLVTPGWLSAWHSFADAWGDRTAVRAMFAETCREVVLLDTGVAPDAEGRLGDFAAHVDRPARILRVGMEHAALRIERWLLRPAADPGAPAPDAVSVHEYAMALDLLVPLTSLPTRASVEERALEIFAALFAPGGLAIEAADAGAPPSSGELSRDGAGFAVPLGRPAGRFGIIKVDRVAHPEKIRRYLPLARQVADVCALAIDRAMTLEALRESESRLREEMEALADARREIRTLGALLPLCAGCKRIRDGESWSEVDAYLMKNTDTQVSHGICPDCVKRFYADLVD